MKTFQIPTESELFCNDLEFNFFQPGSFDAKRDKADKDDKKVNFNFSKSRIIGIYKSKF